MGKFCLKKINPTYNDGIMYHVLGSCMVYFLVCYILLQKEPKVSSFHNSTFADHLLSRNNTRGSKNTKKRDSTTSCNTYDVLG